MANLIDAHRARALAVLVARAAHDVGVPLDAAAGLKEWCKTILTAAQHGGCLDIRIYRALSWVWGRVHG